MQSLTYKGFIFIKITKLHPRGSSKVFFASCKKLVLRVLLSSGVFFSYKSDYLSMAEVINFNCKESKQ